MDSNTLKQILQQSINQMEENKRLAMQIGNVEQVLRLTQIANSLGQIVDPDGGDFAEKVTISGSTTYVARAAPWTLESQAKWKVKKIVDTGGTSYRTTWADGNAEYDNIATNLTTLTYV